MRASLGLLIVVLAAFAFAPPASADEPQAGGIIETVNNPITAGVISQIKSRVEAARTNPRNNVKKVLFNFNPEGRDAATEDFGPSYDLAKYIRSLRNNGIQTIAFVNGKTTRHTVLPVIACDQVAMSSTAKLGAVRSNKDATLDNTELNAYLEMAGRIDRMGPVRRMFDPNVKLVMAMYKGAPVYVDSRRLEAKDPAYAEVQAANLNEVPNLPPGIALYDVKQAIQFHVADVTADTLDEARDKYGLPPNALANDPLGGKAMHPVLITLEGTIDTAMQEKVRRQVETAKAREENTFFFKIETAPGGDPAAARNLADFLIALGKTPEYPARTIAFVPGDAPDLAVFLAFACQELYMYKGPDPRSEAVIGDFSTLVGPPNQRQQHRNVNAKFVQDNLAEVAEQTGHSKLLVEGMFNPDVVIVRARNQQDGERRLMTEDELKTLKDKGWVLESMVKPKGTLLRVTASKAADLRIAKTVDSKDVGEVYAQLGVEAKDVRSSEPSWLDNFAAFLRRPEVSILLVIIGIAGMVLEMKAPGLIIPGVVAAVCFILFFWAQTQLGGQLIYLAIMLFLLGLALIGIEIFLIPGFGVTGVCGILLVLAGLVLASLDRAPESSGDWADLVKKLLTYGLTMAGAVVLAFVLSRYLPKIPYANRLMLVPPEDRPEVEELSALPGVEMAVALLGQVGTATSMLRPAGTAKFGDRYIDVVTEGDFIPPGTAIQVVEVEGTRIVVKRV
jgi:membrane-bound ClpP family serine protease